MDDVEGDVGAEVETPPDGRAGAVEVDPNPVDGHVVPGWPPQAWSRFLLSQVVEAGDN